MINLLPHKEKQRIDRIRFLRTAMLTVWALIILVAVAGLLLFPTMTTIRSRYVLAQSEIERLQNTGVVLKSEDVDSADTRAQALKKQFASPTGKTPVEIIEALRALAPSGIALSGFTFENGAPVRIEIKGVVSTREVLQAYADAIKRQDMVAIVDSPISNYLKQKDNEFTLTVTFK